MPIHQPSKVLFRNLPLSFVARRTGGHGSKSVNIEIPLIPFIDLQICLVVFLLMSFSSSGELVTQRNGLHVPMAEHTKELELAPVLSVDNTTVVLDGRRVADTVSLAADAKVERIEPLIAQLETLKRNWSLLHPRDDFPGALIMQADMSTDYRVIKKLMFAAAQAGYPNVRFAVTKAAANGVP
jgi:biopolymer transport protein ExbD